MNSSEDTKVVAVMILDVIGRPPEHLIASLEEIIKEIDKEKGISVIRKEIKEPRTMENQKDFFTTFAEVELEAEEILYLVALMFKYMPAHLEIIRPEIIAVQNNSWNDILNELIRRLHGYDEIARVMQLEKQALMKKIHELGGEVTLAPAMPVQPGAAKDVEGKEEKPKKRKSKKSLKKSGRTKTKRR